MIIALAHQKGGVGKTTVAWHLAVELKPDFVIELDTHNSFSVINSFREQPMDVKSVDTRAGLIELIKQAKENNLLVIIDCGGYDFDLNRIAIAAADKVVIPAIDDLTEEIGLVRFSEILREISEQVGHDVTGQVLINKANPNKKHFDTFIKRIENCGNLNALGTIIRRRNQYGTAIKRGLGITEYQKTKHSFAARDIRVLAAELTLEK